MNRTSAGMGPAARRVMERHEAGYPNFPGEMLRIAQQDDDRAANPLPFGSVPPDPRLRPRSW